MKVFTGTVDQSEAISDVIVPDTERHLRSHRAEAVVVAPTKAAALAQMETLGVNAAPIRSVAGTGLKVERNGYNRQVERLIEAGLVDPARPGAVFYARGVKGYVIAESSPDGVRAVGRWAYTSAAGLHVEPIPAGS